MGKKAASVFDEVRIGTIIGTNAVVDGNFSSTDAIRIDGVVNGDVTSEAIVVVDVKGTVNGTVTAQSILIAGTINGDSKASGKTEVTGTGKIYGDITTRTLAIDEKAIFVGKCNMNPSAEDEEFGE